jgi:hypothetical protein
MTGNPVNGDGQNKTIERRYVRLEPFAAAPDEHPTSQNLNQGATNVLSGRNSLERECLEARGDGTGPVDKQPFTQQGNFQYRL